MKMAKQENSWAARSPKVPSSGRGKIGNAGTVKSLNPMVSSKMNIKENGGNKKGK